MGNMYKLSDVENIFEKEAHFKEEIYELVDKRKLKPDRLANI
jgi:hypothetical protein